MTVGRNKSKFNQEGFYLGKYQMELTRDYNHLGFEFHLHGYFEPSSKRWQIACKKVCKAALRKKRNSSSHMWELESHLSIFEALMLPTFTYGAKI